MRRPFFPVLVGLCAASSLSFGSQPGLSLPQVLTRMADSQRAIQNAKVQFVEELKASPQAGQKIAGTLFFKRPSHLLIEQRSPEKQRLLSDGQRVWIYSPAAAQQLTADWKNWLTQTGFPAPLLNFVSAMPADEWAEHYRVLFGGYDDHLYRVIFQPKRVGDLPVELWISDNDFLPVRGQMDAPAGKIEVSFKTWETNRGVKDALFSPSVPPGTAIVPFPS